MSTIKFNVEDSKAAEILKVILNSGIAVTYIEAIGDQHPQTMKDSAPSIIQSQPSLAANQPGNANALTFVPDAKTVGGTIFYIDDTADGAYEFLDARGNSIETVKVGDRPYAYRVIKKGSKDKYYVYHDEVYDNLKWTYYKKEAYVYEPLGTSPAIGCGKINTEIVMAKDNGAYITADSNGAPTIWYQLQQTRLAKAGGCDDWFIPSTHEISKARAAVISGNITGGTIAGSSFEGSVFTNKWLWSSSESTDHNTWLWGCGIQRWHGNGKYGNASVFFARAF